MKFTKIQQTVINMEQVTFIYIEPDDGVHMYKQKVHIHFSGQGSVTIEMNEEELSKFQLYIFQLQNDKTEQVFDDLMKMYKPFFDKFKGEGDK